LSEIVRAGTLFLQALKKFAAQVRLYPNNIMKRWREIWSPEKLT